ncbi:MAG TPA: ABC transporter ATP-binding protein [Burkholderiales bacterium]|nr:ABC transporter ATP-binding protein [Burkholderiales bacterium]
MTSLLKAEQLTVAVGGRTLVRELELAVAPGEMWAVLGQNGSGKTTLLHTLAGLVPAAAGQVSIGDKPAAAYTRRELGRQLGILLQQEAQEFWGTLRDYVTLGRHPHLHTLFGTDADDDAAVDAALAAFDLAALAARAYQTLSGGERQRARLAQLWAQDPALLLLDEPLQHLDLRHQLQLFERVENVVRERNRAALIVLHDLAWAGRCDKALLLYGDGRWRAGTAAELLDAATLESLYGCRLRAFGAGADAHLLPVI